MRARRPGQWVGAVLVLVLFAMLVHTLVTNERFQWNVVGDYFATGSIMRGLLLTLWMTAAVMACGFLLGIGLAAMRLSSNPVLRTLSFGYVWLVRSVPPLVQLLFWFEIASLYPHLSLGIPFGPEFVTVSTAHLFTGVLAAFVGLTIDTAAFSARSLRGQSEAAEAIGLGRGRIFRRIVLPQALVVGLEKLVPIVHLMHVAPPASINRLEKRGKPDGLEYEIPIQRILQIPHGALCGSVWQMLVRQHHGGRNSHSELGCQRVVEEFVVRRPPERIIDDR